MSSPVIVTDFDGVFNIMALGIDDARTFQSDAIEIPTILPDGSSFDLIISPSMVDRINDISKRIRIVWATSWGEDIVSLSEQVGFLPFKWLVTPEDHQGEWWKLDAVKEMHDPSSPLIWIDDELKYERESLEWVSSTPLVSGVSPTSYKGLSPIELLNIERLILTES